MKLLHVESSILGAQSASRSIAGAIVARLVRDRPEVDVVTRDLVADPLPHMTPANAPSTHRISDKAATEADGDRAVSDAVLAEFVDADIVVIGAPMYNFSLPSQLKAWIDRIVISGVTFQVGPGGLEGLCGGKRVIVAISRGGVYASGSPMAAAEHLETLLRSIFGFLGVANVETIVAEGFSQGPEVGKAAIDGALRSVSDLAA